MVFQSFASQYLRPSLPFLIVTLMPLSFGTVSRTPSFDEASSSRYSYCDAHPSFFGTRKEENEISQGMHYPSSKKNFVREDLTSSNHNVWDQVGLPRGDTIYIFRDNLVICYDSTRRNPKWVMERIDKISTNKFGSTDNSKKENLINPTKAKDSQDATSSPLPTKRMRDEMRFHEEKDIPEKFRAHLSHFYQSGYDRGHNVPSANHQNSKEAMKNTFTLANISPQVGEGFNRDYWARIESMVRNWVLEFDELYIVTGPMYIPTRFLKEGEDMNTLKSRIKDDVSTLLPLTLAENKPNHSAKKMVPESSHSQKNKYLVAYHVLGEPPEVVAVPNGFYKVIVGINKDPHKKNIAVAIAVPNSPIPEEYSLSKFIVPFDALERLVGFSFFPNALTEENKAYLDNQLLLYKKRSQVEVIDHNNQPNIDVLTIYQSKDVSKKNFVLPNFFFACDYIPCHLPIPFYKRFPQSSTKKTS